MSKNSSPPPTDVLQKLQRAVRHRGPDGDGLHVSEQTALVHTRLAIIDVQTGAQPFVSSEGIALVANGEIYNDPQIRQALRDEPYKTGSDNESILHLYRRYGLRFVDHLGGMYALALHDPVEDRLVLARDPFGIKPLYIADTPDAFWFSSEPAAFVEAGLIAPKENAPAREKLFGLQFVSGEAAAITGVTRVAPGETLVIKSGEIMSRSKRTVISKTGGLPQANLPDFGALWLEAVDRHRRSDVSYGVFLSGGIDSSALLAAMAQLESRPVIAYTAAFDSPEVHDETALAAGVAQSVGADHRPIMIAEDDFITHLPAIAAALDDPVADYAVVPTFLLAKAAAKDVKVVLTGEGGDEVFGGYGRYRAASRPWPFRKAPWRRHRLPESLFKDRSNQVWRDDIAATERSLAGADWSRLQRAQLLDIAHWLPDDLLCKVDRCLMAHGVEGRVPFLAEAVAQYGLNLPDSAKVRGRLGKWIVRSWLDRHLPQAAPFSRKRGFTVPVASWLQAHGSALADAVAAQPGVQHAFDEEAVRGLFQSVTPQTGFAAWMVLFYALWHQCHMVGVASHGDVYEVLNAN